MGKFFDQINNSHRDFVAKQQMYFVASAPLSKEGRVNLSPKGLDSFRMLQDNLVGYMDVISSGNETSAHTLENGRITIMFCSFGEKPMILRFYGQGRAVLRGSSEWDKWASKFEIYPSTRQLMLIDVDLVQTSCGFGVPMYDYVGQRDVHFKWADAKGPEDLLEYQRKKNMISLDGLPTGLTDPK